MNEFILITYSLISKISFSPLLLIGLLITSLTLILNLKDSNTYIRKFKKHDNLERFINNIFYTSLYLLLMFIISIFTYYVNNSIILTIVFLILIILIIYNLFIIVYILKEIVRTSLKDDLT